MSAIEDAVQELVDDGIANSDQIVGESDFDDRVRDVVGDMDLASDDHEHSGYASDDHEHDSYVDDDVVLRSIERLAESLPESYEGRCSAGRAVSQAAYKMIADDAVRELVQAHVLAALVYDESWRQEVRHWLERDGQVQAAEPVNTMAPQVEVDVQQDAFIAFRPGYDTAFGPFDDFEQAIRWCYGVGADPHANVLRVRAVR